MGMTKHFSMKQTPQGRQAIGKNQVENSAGGYVFQISNWDRFARFLILGSEGGTYYVGEKKLTVDNANAVVSCVQEDGNRAVDMIVSVSQEGRAVKNEPALFALAIASASENQDVRQYALAALPKVARIGTHLFQFAQYADAMRGWGPSLRKAVAAWYNNMPANKLAYQVVKYPQRVTEQGVDLSRWSHRDLMRKAHPKSDTKHNRIYEYVTQGNLPTRVAADLKILRAAEEMKVADSAKKVVDLIEKYRDQRLPHELVPKQFASKPEVWDALLPDMPYTATLRTLGRLTSYGVLQPGSANLKMVVDRLRDKDYIRKSRVHPLAVLIAMKTYSNGGGYRGNMTWQANAKISDALDDAFYASFGNVEPIGKNVLLALDVSGSMGSPVAGIDNLSAREATACMAMVTARVEDDYEIMGFTSGSSRTRWGAGYGAAMTDLNISPRQRLDEVVRYLNSLPFGGTDCSLPMVYAQKNKLDVDGFVIYTDNETWFDRGEGHPFEVLKKYRAERVADARLAVVATAATDFSIADPSDPGMMDVVGFDTATPNVISSFLRGDLNG